MMKTNTQLLYKFSSSASPSYIMEGVAIVSAFTWCTLWAEVWRNTGPPAASRWSHSLQSFFCTWLIQNELPDHRSLEGQNTHTHKHKHTHTSTHIHVHCLLWQHWLMCAWSPLHSLSHDRRQTTSRKAKTNLCICNTYCISGNCSADMQ